MTFATMRPTRSGRMGTTVRPGQSIGAYPTMTLVGALTRYAGLSPSYAKAQLTPSHPDNLALVRALRGRS